MNATHEQPLVATYRLQLTPSFGFAAAAELLDPLRRLGVSHLYLSPIAEAQPGSTHGYDVVDHRRVRSEFGGASALEQILDDAARHEMGVVIDHVPNHVSVERADTNPHWWQLLREGPTSAAARWFDVDWELTGGTVIVPKLGEPADVLAERGELAIVDGELRYGPLRFPLAAGTEALPVVEALAAQHYDLRWWRDPQRNVRRFFTIDDLVAVRVEHDEVATVVDTIPAMLAEHEAFAGVRIDHVDGLADPQGYLDQLRDRIGDRWIVVEKIVAPGETLPRAWPVAGTTGYEQITVAEHTALDPAGEAPLDRRWVATAQASDQLASFHELETVARREVLDEGLRPDLERLVRVASAVSPLEEGELLAGFVELTLGLDRYRTYLPDPESEAVLDSAMQRAATTSEDTGRLEHVAGLVRSNEEVRTRWQQLTGPVMAKGAEDRAFYRHQRLAALCEVGGDPGAWTYAVDAFHAHQQRVQEGWPTAMLTANTHDTKRSATVRARSLTITSHADEWVRLETEWIDDHRDLTGALRPADVSLALQTVAATGPIDATRLGDFLVKAAREADIATHWTEPDERYEAALGRLAATLVEEATDERSAIGGFARTMSAEGALVGLRLLALQLTCPGVPDLYQGAPAELVTLVDPDNRRVPDWSAWSSLVDEASAGGALDDRIDVARAQLARRVFELRRTHPSAFDARAGYRPLTISDPAAAIAFARLDADGAPAAVTVVALPGHDGHTIVELPGGAWHDLISDEAIADGTTTLAELTGRWGVAVLTRA